MREISLYEVGPRDGFQSVADFIPTKVKKEIISGIVKAGVQHIEFTSFVSPKAIPQMVDAEELTHWCLETYPEIDFFPLVPNLKGAERAFGTGLKKACYVVSVSKTHNQANIRRTHEESLAEFKKIKDRFPDHGLILDLATAFGCPFEGKYHPHQAVSFAEAYVEAGIKEICLCDTIGIADPAQVREMIRQMKETFPDIVLQIHVHDTRNTGMVNTLAAIEQGVDKVQTALGGLGGCPFAPGATGNLASEDLVFMLNEMGYRTGIDFETLAETAIWQQEQIPSGLFGSHQIQVVKSQKKS